MSTKVIPESEVETRIDEINRALAGMRDLEVEKRALLRLQQRAVPEGKAGRRSKGSKATRNGKLKMTDAVVMTVKAKPGIVKGDLADVVIEQTGKPRRIVMSTIGNVKDRGRIKDDGKGGYVMP